MDGISAGASVAGLISLAETVITRVVKYLKAVKDAEKEISQLLDETTSVSGLFAWVKKVLEEAHLENENGTGLEIIKCVKRYDKVLEKLRARLKPFSSHDGEAGAGTSTEGTRQKKSKWIWPFSKKETGEIIAELQRNKADVQLALSTEDWMNTRTSIGYQKKITDNLIDIRTLAARNLSLVEAQGSAKQTRELLDWLTIYDPSESHQNAQQVHQEGTGEWIFEQPEYEDWLASSSALLWLYGIPGAGKTILASVIVEQLFKTLPGGVAYFYCSHKSTASQEARNVLGSVCRQLVLQNLDCMKDLKAFYRQHNPEGLPRKALREQDLGVFIQKISQHFASATIVIDGLDECGAAAGIDRSELVHILSRLHMDDASRVRLIVASRQESDIGQAFQPNCASLPIAANPADLRLYVRAEVTRRANRLRFRNVEFRDQVIETLIEGAKGMFQWCRCQLDDLCRLPNDAERKKALGRLPKDLPATYIRILERIDRDYPPETTILVKRALKWLVLKRQGSGGHLSLLALAQAISLSDQLPDYFDLNQVPHEMDLVEWCSSLVSLSKKGNTLTLSHFTVEEFLRQHPDKISSPVARSYLVDAHTDYYYLVESCLRYLSCRDFEQSRFIPDLKSFSGFDILYPFYIHAAIYLPDYISVLKSDPSNASIFGRFFSRQNSQMFLFWSQFVANCTGAQSDNMRSWYFKRQGLTLIQAAAGFLLVSAVNRLLQHGQYAKDDADGDKASALHLCIGGPISSKDVLHSLNYAHAMPNNDWLLWDKAEYNSRRMQIASLLISAGTDINRMSKWNYGYTFPARPLTPIGAAIYYRTPDLYRLLASHGATLLPTQESFGEEFSALDDLLRGGTMLPRTNDPLNQILDFLLATESCKEHVQKTLNSQKVISGVRGTDSERGKQQKLGESLYFASLLGNITGVQTAIGKGADVEFFFDYHGYDDDGSDHDGPDHGGSDHDGSDGYGSDDYEKDPYGKTPLMVATERGFSDIVTELLQHGAKIDTPCRGGDTPLTWLVRTSGLQKARNIFGDQNIELTNQRKLDAFRHACQSQNPDLLNFITSQGFDVTDETSPFNLSKDKLDNLVFIKAVDERGLLPKKTKKICFLEAIRSGRVDIIEFLLSSTDLTLLRSFGNFLGEVDDINPSSAPGYKVLVLSGFFSPEQILTLLQNIQGKELLDLENVLREVGLPLNYMDGDGNFPIHRACVLNNVSLLRHCINAGADLNQRNLMGDAPLHLVAPAHSHNIEMLELLVSSGADTNLLDEDGESPLHRQFHKRDLDERDLDEQDLDERGVAVLLAAGANPNTPRMRDKKTPFHLAVECQCGPRILSELMNFGADANLLDAEQKTPVRAAILQQHVDAIRLFFLRLGMETVYKTPGRQGRLALHDAAWLQSRSMCLILLAVGADVNAIDNDGQTALHLACATNISSVIKILLDAGAEAKVTDNSGSTALHAAAACDGPSNLKELLGVGVSVSVKGKLGYTPLLVAAYHGRTRNIEALLEHGADVKDSSISGSTALHLAVAGDHVLAMRLLLDKGASLDAVDSLGMTPLDIAMCSFRSGPRKLCAKFLKRKGAKTGAELRAELRADNPGHLCTSETRTSSTKTPVKALANPLLFFETNMDFRLLKELGADLTVRGMTGDTAIHATVSAESLESFNYLVEQGHAVHVPDYCGTLPLHQACFEGNLPLVERLMQLEMSPEVLKTVSAMYGTPLAAAALRDNPDLLELLLDAGADVDDGSHPWLGPPLFVSIAYGRRGNVALLLSRGAKKSSENTKFKTAKEVALAYGRIDLLSMLDQD